LPATFTLEAVLASAPGVTFAAAAITVCARALSEGVHQASAGCTVAGSTGGFAGR
jgi:hypothetical protein